MEPADERGAGVLAFEVVGRVEQVLPACLPLAAGQRAEAVEAAGDGAGEAQLALAVGRDGPEQRRAGLMRAVGAPEALDGPVGPPARLQQEVDALLLVLGIERGVVGPAGATRVREDEDALAPFHERRCLDLAGPRRARLELLAAIAAADEALGAARDLGDVVVPEMLQHGVQRRHDRGQRAEVLDQALARRFGLRVVDRVAVVIDHRHRARGAGVVGEDLHLPGRESPLQVVDDVFPRREVDLQVRALVGAEFAETPVEDRFRGGDELEHDRLAIG